MKQIQIFIDTLSATCRLPVYEITKTDCESLATCNQTRYNEEKEEIWRMLQDRQKLNVNCGGSHDEEKNY